MESKMFAFGLFMLFCIVQSGTALKCYNCDSSHHPRCADIKGSGLKAQECEPGSSFGQPICMKTVLSNGISDVVFRNCTFKIFNADACLLMNGSSGKGFKLDFCGTCNTDGCNSGNSIQQFSTLILFGAVVCTARLFI